LASPYNPAKPWDSCFREAARDEDFWRREVDKRVVQFTTAQRSRPQLCDPGFGGIHFATGPGGKRTHDEGDSGEEGGRTKKKSKKERARAATAARAQGNNGGGAGNYNFNGGGPGQQSGGGKGKGKGKNNDAKNPEGKFYRDQGGDQLCWAWNKAHDGCSSPCPAGRAHKCEVCRGNHRTCDHRGSK